MKRNMHPPMFNNKNALEENGMNQNNLFFNSNEDVQNAPINDRPPFQTPVISSVSAFFCFPRKKFFSSKRYV